MLLAQIIRVGLMSMLPIVEQKGAILYGLKRLLMEPWEVYLVSTIAVLIPSPFIILLSKKVFAYLKKLKIINAFINKFEKRLLFKGRNIQKYEYFGLLILVCIPLPGTGVWTGSLISGLLGLDFKKSLFTITIGAIISGLIILGGLIII